MNNHRQQELSPAKQALLQARLKGASSRQSGHQTITKRQSTELGPLSFAQRQMWVLDQITPGNPAYNLPAGYRIRGFLDVHALERSFNWMIERHEILRTIFIVRHGEPVQVVQPSSKIKIASTALDHLPPEEAEFQIQQMASEESIRPFDLSCLPLIRVSLFRLCETEHVLIINMHHIVADGLSLAILWRELDSLYKATRSNTSPELGDLPIQYTDFSAWQQQQVQSGCYTDQAEFWRDCLSGKLPTLDLLCDKPRPALQSFKGSNIFFNIPKSLIQELMALAAPEGCTLFMVVLTAFQIILHRRSNAKDILIGTPVGTRSFRELESLVGNFLNMVILRCDLSDSPSFLQLLQRNRETTLRALSNRELPLEKVIENIRFDRHPNRNPIFQVILQVLPRASTALGGLDVTSFDFDLKFAQFDLSLHLYERADGYRGRFEYCTDLFKAESVERLSSEFIELLKSAVKTPREPLSALAKVT